MKKPFIHKFNTKQNYYIYDINTNNIIKVDQIIYDIIDDYGIIPFSGIVHKWKGKYEEKLIAESLNRIRKSRDVFSPNWPAIMESVICKKHFHESLYKLDDLILNVTERCNMRCKYCSYSGSYYYERIHSQRNMTWKVAKKSLEYFCERAQERDVYNVSGTFVTKEKPNISFYGGECLVIFNFVKKCIEYAKSIRKKPIQFRIDTNGTLINEEIMRFLIENDITLQVSIDGPIEEHDKYRVFKNGNGSFNLIVKNLQKLQKMDKTYYEKRVCFISTLAPSYNLLDIYKFFISNELVNKGTLIVNYVIPRDTDFFKNFSKQTKQQWNEYHENLEKRYIDLRVAANVVVDEFLSNLFERPLLDIHMRQRKPLGTKCGPNGICVPGVRRLFVSVDGKFYPCERVGETFCIGNVDKGIEPRKVKSIVKKYIDGSNDCLNCWAVRLCTVCFTSARKGHRFDFGRKKEICVNVKNDLHDSLVLYARIMEKNPKAFDFVKDIIYG